MPRTRRPAGVPRPHAVSDRRAGHRTGPRYRDIWGTVLVGLASVALFLGFAVDGLAARARADVPWDDSASGKGFLTWAFAQVSRAAGTNQLVGLRLTAGELDLTMRRGDSEQRWQVFPQDLPRLVGSQPITPTSGVVDASDDQAQDLSLVWTDYQEGAGVCSTSDLMVTGAATWGGAMHFTASCRSGAVGSQEWIGSWPVELQGTLSTRYSLGVMISDLGKLSPSGVASLDLTMAGVDAVGCRAATTWRQQVGSGTQWISQSRLCYTPDQTSSYLPVGTVEAPADAQALQAHPLQLSSVDSSVLEGLTGSSGLPSNQSGIQTLRIAWSDRFDQQVIEAHSGEGDSARTGWYTLSGRLLALERG